MKLLILAQQFMFLVHEDSVQLSWERCSFKKRYKFRLVLTHEQLLMPRSQNMGILFRPIQHPSATQSDPFLLITTSSCAGGNGRGDTYRAMSFITTQFEFLDDSPLCISMNLTILDTSHADNFIDSLLVQVEAASHPRDLSGSKHCRFVRIKPSHTNSNEKSLMQKMLDGLSWLSPDHDSWCQDWFLCLESPETIVQIDYRQLCFFQIDRMGCLTSIG